MSFQLDGISNFRSLVGVPTTEGRKIKPNVLFRSDELSRLSESDWQKLQENRLAAICDLRRPDERENYMTQVPEGHNVSLYWWPYDEESTAMMLGMAEKIREAMAPLAAAPDEVLDAWIQGRYEHYGGGFVQIAPHIRSVVDVVLKHQGEGAVLIHCAAGKDRTGFAIASLLAAVQVDREEILNDYVKTSEGYLLRPPPREHLLPLLSRHGLDQLPQRVMDKLCVAYRGAMAAALDHLVAQYGSIDGYLETVVKITPEERALLREILTE